MFQIGEALYNRIMRAFRAKQKFRVFVVMPLLPGFEGEVGAPSGTSLHAVTHWNYQSISRSVPCSIKTRNLQINSFSFRHITSTISAVTK